MVVISGEKINKFGFIVTEICRRVSWGRWGRARPGCPRGPKREKGEKRRKEKKRKKKRKGKEKKKGRGKIKSEHAVG